MGLVIADGLVLHFTSAIGGLMIVKGNSPVMLLPVGILGNIAVALSKGIIIFYSSVAYAASVEFDVTKFDLLIRPEEAIIMFWNPRGFKSVAMGNHIL